MIIEKINEVNERVEELMKAETQIIKKIEELQNMLKEIDNEKMVLKGSYNTLVALVRNVELEEFLSHKCE